MQHIEIKTHDLHHEAIRFAQFDQDFWAYYKRTFRVTRPQKMVAIAVFSLYRVDLGGPNQGDFSRLAEIMLRQLKRLGVETFSVSASRSHYCMDKAYRLDEFADQFSGWAKIRVGRHEGVVA